MSGKSRKKYIRQFKEEAVKLITEQGYKVSEAARNLGIAANCSADGKRITRRG